MFVNCFINLCVCVCACVCVCVCAYVVCVCVCVCVFVCVVCVGGGLGGAFVFPVACAWVVVVMQLYVYVFMFMHIHMFNFCCIGICLASNDAFVDMIVVANSNYLAAGRLDINFGARKVAKHIAKPMRVHCALSSFICGHMVNPQGGCKHSSDMIWFQRFRLGRGYYDSPRHIWIIVLFGG